MKYVTRRIQIKKPDGNLDELSDIKFSKLDAPLILLGEPGAGKTEITKAICKASGSNFILADRLASEAPYDLSSSDKLVVIDGFDEILAQSSNQPLEVILKKLHDKGIQKFILTCRAADWENIQNEQKVQSWFGKKPIIGHIQPLNDNEISSMVKSFGSYSDTGEHFVIEAKKRGVLDLARNPQLLRMLLAAITENGWPNTKTKLYELACVSMAKEENPIHQSLKPNRLENERLLEVAGFICAQLLLSGKRGVNTNGLDDDIFPRYQTLKGKNISVEDVKAVISSKLFRPTDSNSVEPAHRTVSEYLAARWIASALKNTLSKRRLDAIIYSRGTVPTSLRGVHAWLATLDRNYTNQLVSKDPYGCLRYGDIEQFTTPQIRNLLSELQNLVKVDPYFRGDDWSIQVNSGFDRPELKEDVVKLIQNENTSFHLSILILESLEGTKLAKSLHDDLHQLVLNDEKTFAERHRALSAISVNYSNDDWIKLIQNLRGLGLHDSLRLAVESMANNIKEFCGKEIGLAINAYTIENEKSSHGLMLGIGFRLIPRMNAEQLIKAIPIISAELSDDIYNHTAVQRKLSEYLVASLTLLLQMDIKVSAKDLWSWLQNITHNYDINKWHNFSTQYFKKHPLLRQKVQSLALKSALNDDDLWMLESRLNNIASGFFFREEDVIFHLNSLLLCNERPENFLEQWKTLVRLAINKIKPYEKAIELAEKQTNGNADLQNILDELNSRPKPKDWKKEEETRQKKYKAEQQRNQKIRHSNYADISASIRNGTHLGALKEISMAYIGFPTRYSEIKDPIERIKELVGSENLEDAQSGLVVALHHEDIPSPKEAKRLRVKEGKEYNLELITLAGCAVHIAQGNNLEELPQKTLQCALAACQWGLYSSEKHATLELQEQLERQVYSTPKNIEQFVRDVIELELFSGANHVSGIYDITHQKKYSEVCSKLALEWLNESQKISAQSLRALLVASLRLSKHSELVDLIEKKLKAGIWPNDEHKRLWIGAAFAVDFDKFEDEIKSFAGSNAETLWALIELRVTDYEPEEKPQPLSLSQLSFLINTFAPKFPLIESPSSSWGSNHPYNGAQFIAGCITKIGGDLSKEARDILETALNSGILGNHSNHARHVLATHIRESAESDWQNHTLDGVRQVLLAGQPKTIDDLQGVVIDELEALQERLKNGVYNGILPFWDDTQPHPENYCRDRIAEHLEPYLSKYGVRVHKEGTMPDEKRCDLLCTIGEIDLPIEIKGQWHKNLWKAACEQLEDNYSRNYRSNGRGIYLTIWFGNVSGKNPPKPNNGSKPKTADEMNKAIIVNSPREMSPLTKILVLDVSKSNK